ncbi:SGNH/GDSL hydrolase family protein [uncultured Bradyrhizobium sp.]|uniref:SGNH/GDSL hydrolase family protein n=1 Tax=uncultured Bradyrhizobium sp. TaxID=199684 RepID=UPI0026262A56|nr:SGNH/GDSL hydrolase family protein [uncultured Bradyrhizobium sp.]
MTNQDETQKTLAAKSGGHQDTSSRNELRVCIFGDSICFGQGVSVEQIWVAEMARGLQRQFPSRGLNFFNPSINGNTTRMALERMPQDVQAHKPHLAVVQFGLNDANFWVSDQGHPRVSALAYEANLREIVDRLRLAGAEKVILNTNHTTDAGGAPERKISPLAPQTYRDHIVHYNDIVRRVAEAKRCPLIDIEHHWLRATGPVGSAHQLLLEDGVHLSVSGHQLYTQVMLPVMAKQIEMLISSSG